MVELYWGKNLRFLRKQKGFNQTELAENLGFSKTQWSNWEVTDAFPSVLDLIKISAYFGFSESEMIHSDLSKGKISEKTASTEKGKISGKEKGKIYPENNGLSVARDGDLSRMPKIVTVDTSGHDRAVLVPVRARAGYLAGYGDPEYIGKLQSFELPNFRGRLNRLFEVEGNSMNPTLHGGDIVVGQFVENVGQIRDDRVHIIVTRDNGVVVKRCLNRVEKEGLVVLKSDNWRERDTFPTLTAFPEDILEVWYVAGSISRQLPPPTRDYQRINDLEVQFTLMNERLKKAGL